MNHFKLFVVVLLIIRSVSGDLFTLMSETDQLLERVPLNERLITDLLCKLDELVRQERWPARGVSLLMIHQLKKKFATRKIELSTNLFTDDTTSTSVVYFTTQSIRQNEIDCPTVDHSAISRDIVRSTTELVIEEEHLITDAVETIEPHTTERDDNKTAPSTCIHRGEYVEQVSLNSTHTVLYSVLLLLLFVCNLVWWFFYRRLREAIRQMDGHTYAQFDPQQNTALISKSSLPSVSGEEETEL